MLDQRNVTRRAGLKTGAKLAFAAPAVVAGLRAGTVFADSGTGTTGTRAGTAVRTPLRTAAGTATRSPFATAAATTTTTNTTTTTKTTTTTDTTTTVDGQSALVSVLGRGRLCLVASDGTEHRTRGQARLLSGANGTHFHVHVFGAGDRQLTIVSSPAGALNGKVVTLKRGRAAIAVTAAQASPLAVASSKDFASGFRFQLSGSTVRTFVICPHRD